MPTKCAILLVEDDENDAFFFKRALRQLGFPGKIYHATETSEAKLCVRGEGPYADRVAFPSPELIVADSSITVRDSGVEFLEWVRAHAPDPNIPFIVFSGGISDQTRERANAAGVQKILSKTSSQADLLLRLREIIQEFPPDCRQWLA